MTYIPWPGEKSQAQSSQLSDCFKRERAAEAQWMLGVDIGAPVLLRARRDARADASRAPRHREDEFLVVVPHTLSEEPLLKPGGGAFVMHKLLKLFERARMGAIILDRLNFNCNGHREPTGGLVTRDFTHRTVSLRPHRVVGKPLVMLKALEKVQSAHMVRVQEPRWRMATADRAVWSNATVHHTYEPFRVNHYSTRSYAECIEKSTSHRRQPGNWRLKHGAALCDKAMAGTPLFKPEENAPDASLALSGLPDAVDAVRRLLPPAGAAAARGKRRAGGG